MLLSLGVRQREQNVFFSHFRLSLVSSGRAAILFRSNWAVRWDFQKKGRKKEKAVLATTTRASVQAWELLRPFPIQTMDEIKVLALRLRRVRCSTLVSCQSHTQVG